MGNITDKKQVVKYIEDYLKEENSFADLTGIINDICPLSHQNSAFVRDIAHRMNRTGRYAIREMKNGNDVRHQIWPVPKESFYKRYPGWSALAICVFTIGLTKAADLLFPKKDDLKDYPEYIQQQQSNQHQSDSLKNLHLSVKALQDSLK